MPTPIPGTYPSGLNVGEVLFTGILVFEIADQFFNACRQIFQVPVVKKGDQVPEETGKGPLFLNFPVPCRKTVEIGIDVVIPVDPVLRIEIARLQSECRNCICSGPGPVSCGCIFSACIRW